MPNPGPAITNTPQTKAVLQPVNTNGPANSAPAEQNALRLLALGRGINANAAATDTPLSIINSADYSVDQVVITNASISLSTATGGLFTAPAAGGTAIVATAALSALTGPTIVNKRTVASSARQTAQTLYWRSVVAQGAVATFDCYVYGFDFTPYTDV
ncbi:MAG: hypothetical protein IT325_09855 [Anaerolineae bacterium]|nr:hypothetical protein [Anaerolineae bacterium]